MSIEDDQTPAQQVRKAQINAEKNRIALAIQPELEAWLKANDLTSDTHFHSREKWDVERGEEYGRNAILTITAEGSGSISRIYNYPETKDDYALVEAFEAIAKKHGCFFERGYSWSWHLYQA